MLLNFITTMRTLDLVVLLVTPRTTLMPSVIFRYSEQGFVQHADGVTVMIIFIVIFGHLLLSKLGAKVELEPGYYGKEGELRELNSFRPLIKQFNDVQALND